ncbi:hypothetical protein D3C71_22090 [compost metagenome]
MGSFNITCCASRQTVIPGALCRVIAIEQSSSYRPVSMKQQDEEFSAFGIANSSCYPDAFWGPFGGFIEAKYHDYGQVELVMNAHTRASVVELVAELLKKAPTVLEGENSSHDLPFDLPAFLQESAPRLYQALATAPRCDMPEVDESFDSELVACWDHVWEVAQEHRLFVRNHFGAVRPLQFAVFHEAAFQTLVTLRSSGTSWGKQPRDPRSFVLRTLEELKKQAAEHQERRAKARAEAGAPSDASEDAIFTRWMVADRLCERLNQIGRSEGSGGFLHRSASDLVAAHVEGKLALEQLLEQLVPLLAPCYAVGGMDELNLKFTPIEYAGQDYSNSIGQAYAHFVGQVSAQCVRDINEHRFGQYRTYTLQASSPELLGKLQTDSRGWECHLQVLQVENIGSSPAEGLAVTLETTMDEEYFGQLLAEVNDPLMQQTVRLKQD